MYVYGKYELESRRLGSIGQQRIQVRCGCLYSAIPKHLSLERKDVLEMSTTSESSFHVSNWLYVLSCSIFQFRCSEVVPFDYVSIFLSNETTNWWNNFASKNPRNGNLQKEERVHVSASTSTHAPSTQLQVGPSCSLSISSVWTVPSGFAHR